MTLAVLPPVMISWPMAALAIGAVAVSAPSSAPIKPKAPVPFTELAVSADWVAGYDHELARRFVVDADHKELGGGHDVIRVVSAGQVGLIEVEIDGSAPGRVGRRIGAERHIGDRIVAGGDIGGIEQASGNDSAGAHGQAAHHSGRECPAASEVPRITKLPEGVVEAAADCPASKPETAGVSSSALTMMPVLVAESMVKAKVALSLKPLNPSLKVMTPRRLLSRV